MQRSALADREAVDWHAGRTGERPEAPAAPSHRSSQSSEVDTVGDPKPLSDGHVADALLLTPEEAAKSLRVGRTTIYALIKAGELRPVRIGRSCRLSLVELQRYVRRLEAPAPVQPRSPARRRSTANQRGLFDV